MITLRKIFLMMFFGSVGLKDLPGFFGSLECHQQLRLSRIVIPNKLLLKDVLNKAFVLSLCHHGNSWEAPDFVKLE